MPKLNEDGNLLGRCSALAIILLSTFYAVRFMGGGCCPAGSKDAKTCPMRR